MNTLKTLLRKDYYVNRKGILVPVWITAGFYFLFLLSILFAAFRGKVQIDLGNIPAPFLLNTEIHKLLSFTIHPMLYVSALGLTILITVISIASSLLNQDIKQKSELFHRSQPVSIWELTGSRFLVGIFGTLLVGLLLGIINYIVVNIIMMTLTPLHVNWWLGFNGMLFGFLHLAFPTILLGSFCFLLSAVFRDNAFGKFILLVISLEVLAGIIRYALHLNVPSPIGALARYLGGGVQTMMTTIAQFKYGAFTFQMQAMGGNSIAGFKMPAGFLTDMWGTVFTWGNGLKLLISAGFYAVATIIYQKREIQA
jgi:hypothetical protein